MAISTQRFIRSTYIARISGSSLWICDSTAFLLSLMSAVGPWKESWTTKQFWRIFIRNFTLHDFTCSSAFWKLIDLTNSKLYETRKPCCRKETTRCCKCSFRSKFASNIPYKYKTSHASKAMLQSSKHAGAKHNLTPNQDSKSIKVKCLESVEKQWGNK